MGKLDTMLSVIHHLSMMNVEQIEEAIIVINEEPTFNEKHKTAFTALCSIAIEEKRRHRGGERKV